MLNLAQTILHFALAISPLVFFHELGHYFAGRVFGVKAEAFSIGFGRPLLKWQDRRGTEWRVGWLPLGGYVRFAGEMNATSKPDEGWRDLPDLERAETLHARAVWQRAIIVAAGPFTNFLLAIVMLVGLFATVGEPRVAPVVGMVAAGTPAHIAGLRPGDRIVELDGHHIESFDDVATLVQVRTGQVTPFVIERSGRRLDVEMAPRQGTTRDLLGIESKVGQIGVRPAGIEYVRPSLAELPASAVRFTAHSLKLMARTMGQIVSGQRSVEELGGPVKVAAASDRIADFGLVAFLFFMVMLSINLGFINLLPIPMLDGGHLALFAVEAMKGRPVSVRAQDWAYRGGLAALLAFTVFVTVNDLSGLGLFQRLAGLIG